MTNVTEKAKEIFQFVGEKIGLVTPSSQKTEDISPPTSIGTAEDHGQAKDEWNSLEQQKPFMERAKDTMYQAGEKIGLVGPSNAEVFTIYSDSKRRVYINEHGQITEEKPLMERAKESVYQAGEKIGLINPESGKSFTERAKETLYQAGERVGLVPTGTSEETTENEKPLSTEKVREEILEVRENMGLAQPEETQAEKGKRIALTEEERKPLSSQKAKEEILEKCENMGLDKPMETKPESGKVLQDNTFIKIHLPKVGEANAAFRKHLPA